MNREKYLKELPIELIEENPENPRIVFRQEELDDLLVSINKMLAVPPLRT